jgi:zinc transport system permease protein
MLETVESLVDAACLAIAGLGGLKPYAPFVENVWMARGLVTMLLIGPLLAAVGLQVVNFRLAFFSEAIGHSAYTGVALGIILGSIPSLAWLPPQAVMVTFGALVAIIVTAYRRGTSLSGDTVIGVFSSTVISLGLVLIYMFDPKKGGGLNGYLIGNLLTVQPIEVAVLALFFLLAMVTLGFTFNRLLLTGLNPALATTLGVPVAALDYGFATLLAVLVMFSIPAVGILTVTSMLVIPAAAARNLARGAFGLFWWGAAIATLSGVVGLVVSFEWDTPVGASAVLCNAVAFALSALVARWRKS